MATAWVAGRQLLSICTPCRSQSPPTPRSQCLRHEEPPALEPGGSTGPGVRSLATEPRPLPPAGCGAGLRRGAGGGVKTPLTAWVAWARASVGKYQSGGIQGSGSSCASSASHLHPESGGAAETVPVCRKGRPLLSGCLSRVAARLNPSAAGATGRPPWGLRQRKSWSAGQAWRSRAISSAVPLGLPSGARCHIMASTAHVEKGHAHGVMYTWMVHCGRARRTLDAWSTPRTMSAARTSTIPVGSTTIPSAGPPWRPGVCRATFVRPVWVTRSTASWMFTLPRVV